MCVTHSMLLFATRFVNAHQTVLSNPAHMSVLVPQVRNLTLALERERTKVGQLQSDLASSSRGAGGGVAGLAAQVRSQHPHSGIRNPDHIWVWDQGCMSTDGSASKLGCTFLAFTPGSVRQLWDTVPVALHVAIM